MLLLNNFAYILKLLYNVEKFYEIIIKRQNVLVIW